MIACKAHAATLILRQHQSHAKTVVAWDKRVADVWSVGCGGASSFGTRYQELLFVLGPVLEGILEFCLEEV